MFMLLYNIKPFIVYKNRNYKFTILILVTKRKWKNAITLLKDDFIFVKPFSYASEQK